MELLAYAPYFVPTIAMNTTHELYYLRLKTRNPLRLVAAYIMTIGGWPLTQWLTAVVPVLMPLTVVGYVAFCMWAFRCFATHDSYSRIFLCGSLVMAFTQATRLALLFGLVLVLDTPAPAAIETLIWLHPVVFLAVTPLLFRYVRSKVVRLLDLAENQRWLLVGLPPILLTIMGGITNTILLRLPDSYPVMVLSLLMPVSIVAYFISIYLFLVNHHDKTVLGQRLAAAERLAETYEYYDSQLAEKEIRVQRLRHDFRHLVVHLEQLAREQDCDAIIRELAAVSAVNDQTAIKPFCENRTVNAVVSSYFSKAAKLGVNCVATAFVPEKLTISKADLSMLLGNALENSIKGAGPLGERGYITFDARPGKQYMVFVVTNNYSPGSYVKGKGVGIVSIKHTCEQHQGRIEITDSDGTYSLAMFLMAL